MSRPLGLVGTVGGSVAFGGAPPVGLVPFTLLAGLAVGIASPCGTAFVGASDFVNTIGSYQTYTICKTIDGVYSDTLTYSCAELGTLTVYVKGLHSPGGETLIKTTEVQVSDQNFFCDGC